MANETYTFTIPDFIPEGGMGEGVVTFGMDGQTQATSSFHGGSNATIADKIKTALLALLGACSLPNDTGDVDVTLDVFQDDGKIFELTIEFTGDNADTNLPDLSIVSTTLYNDITPSEDTQGQPSDPGSPTIYTITPDGVLDTTGDNQGGSASYGPDGSAGGIVSAVPASGFTLIAGGNEFSSYATFEENDNNGTVVEKSYGNGSVTTDQQGSAPFSGVQEVQSFVLPEGFTGRVMPGGTTKCVQDTGTFEAAIESDLSTAVSVTEPVSGTYQVTWDGTADEAPLPVKIEYLPVLAKVQDGSGGGGGIVPRINGSPFIHAA